MIEKIKRISPLFRAVNRCRKFTHA